MLRHPAASGDIGATRKKGRRPFCHRLQELGTVDLLVKPRGAENE